MPHGKTRRRTNDVIEAVLQGHVDFEDITAMHAEVLAMLATGGARAVTIDVSTMKRFSPRVRDPGVAFLTMLRDHDVHLVVVRGASALVRMTASAIALAAGLPFRFVADDEEARTAIAEHIAGLKRKTDAR